MDLDQLWWPPQASITKFKAWCLMYKCSIGAQLLSQVLNETNIHKGGKLHYWLSIYSEFKNFKDPFHL